MALDIAKYFKFIDQPLASSLPSNVSVEPTSFDWDVLRKLGKLILTGEISEIY